MKRHSSSPGGPYWSVSSLLAAFAVILMSAINTSLMDTGIGNALEFLLGAILGTIVVIIGSLIAGLIAASTRNVPLAAVSLIGGAILAIWVLKENGPAAIARMLLDAQQRSLDVSQGPLSALSLSIMMLAIATLGGVITLFAQGKFTALKPPPKALLVIATVTFTGLGLNSVLGLLTHGSDPYPDDGAHPTAIASQNAPGNPASPGTFAVRYMTYGAGSNPRRPEFAQTRDLDSRTVDARKLLPEWKGLKQTMRERYWGFTLAEAPLNGHVWMPEGDGPYPLVLIVHGNHGMEDYSDDGYEYLGQLLASRGFITVSVDQNYINGSWSGDFQGKEMAARAWLLLEHLAQWRDWNDTPGHPFESRVDLDNIGLIGHSRGGEAVSIAHSFNSLSNFPDDATLAFNYGFNIRALVAIAQVDQRYHRRVQLTDVNFFTIHGSYDSDEPAYHGLRQMNRIHFTNNAYFFKAGVYVHGANHGQFNTGWGRYDYGPPGAWELNTAAIIPGEEQREAAKVYISAFLESALHQKLEYLSMLKDPRQLESWLPRQTYVHQFMDSSFVPFADFEEDINAGTTSQPKGSIVTANLSIWREEALRHRDKRLQGSNAVVLGWTQENAAYTVNIGSSPWITPDRSLVFKVSGSTEKQPTEPEDTADGTPKIADFSVRLRDAAAQQASVLVSQYAQLIPPVRVQYLKSRTRNKNAYNSNWEPVLQYVEIPFSAFASANPSLNLSEIESIRFDFNQSDDGVLILDNIGSAQSR